MSLIGALRMETVVSISSHERKIAKRTQIHGRNGVPLHNTSIDLEYFSSPLRSGSIRRKFRKDLLRRWVSWICRAQFHTSSKVVELKAVASDGVTADFNLLKASSKAIGRVSFIAMIEKLTQRINQAAAPI